MISFNRKKQLSLSCGCEVNKCICGYEYSVTWDQEPKDVGFNRKYPYFKNLSNK